MYIEQMQLSLLLFWGKQIRRGCLERPCDRDQLEVQQDAILAFDAGNRTSVQRDAPRGQAPG